MGTTWLWKEAAACGLLHSEFTGAGCGLAPGRPALAQGTLLGKAAFGNLGGPARGHVLLFREQHSPGGGGRGSVLGMREVSESSEAGLSKELVKRSLVGVGRRLDSLLQMTSDVPRSVSTGKRETCAKDCGRDNGTFCEMGARAGGQAEIRLPASGDQGRHAGEERA